MKGPTSKEGRTNVREGELKWRIGPIRFEETRAEKAGKKMRQKIA